MEPVFFRDSARLYRKKTGYCINGRIEKIFPEEGGCSLPADETIDASGMYLAPGYIDLHTHGAKGLLSDKGRVHLEGICKVLPQYGVTGFLPSICPAASEEEDYELLSSLSKTVSEGAGILGFFLEGHFLALTGSLPGIPENMTK